jgi:hypothetical protein
LAGQELGIRDWELGLCSLWSLVGIDYHLHPDAMGSSRKGDEFHRRRKPFFPVFIYIYPFCCCNENVPFSGNIIRKEKTAPIKGLSPQNVPKSYQKCALNL